MTGTITASGCHAQAFSKQLVLPVRHAASEGERAGVVGPDRRGSMGAGKERDPRGESLVVARASLSLAPVLATARG
jgi:hypothetical protein